MKTITLTRNQITLVDDEDYTVLAQHKWSVVKPKQKFYARRCKNGQYVYMHCEIVGYKGVDHIDGDSLNNQRHNLRPASPTQNAQNTTVVQGKVPYKGVFHMQDRPRTRCYQAQINLRGKSTYLGVYSTPEEAAKAYDAAAIKHFGEFACTNRRLGLL